MNEGLFVLVAVPVLLTAVWLLSRQRKEDKTHRSPSVSHLSEMMRSAELANNGFFRSLDLVQKNLEMLIARAENAEQKLRGLMLHPGVEQREQYTAAALLLAEGHEIDRVSSMLGLPEAQVQLIRELQQVSGKEKRGVTRTKKVEETLEKGASQQSKVAASKEKSSPRPILLVDILKNATAGDEVHDRPSTRFKGVTV